MRVLKNYSLIYWVIEIYYMRDEFYTIAETNMTETSIDKRILIVLKFLIASLKNCIYFVIFKYQRQRKMNDLRVWFFKHE